ncbi:MAG: hypothetical protein IJ366_07600, partial [Clostridia bacterium]|nr:hypothetical protein [Clostridia bacterium]
CCLSNTLLYFSNLQLTKGILLCIMYIEKGKTSNGYAKNIVILMNNRLGRGGYSAFFAFFQHLFETPIKGVLRPP